MLIHCWVHGKELAKTVGKKKKLCLYGQESKPVKIAVGQVRASTRKRLEKACKYTEEL